jgi:hypothetical protein
MLSISTILKKGSNFIFTCCIMDGLESTLSKFLQGLLKKSLSLKWREQRATGKSPGIQSSSSKCCRMNEIHFPLTGFFRGRLFLQNNKLSFQISTFLSFNKHTCGVLIFLFDSVFHREYTAAHHPFYAEGIKLKDKIIHYRQEFIM